MNKIGIIGKGFVGTAVAQGFSPHSGYESEVKIFDKDPTRTINTLDEVVVTALGISREKKSLGYSVTEVSGDEINSIKDVKSHLLHS